MSQRTAYHLKPIPVFKSPLDLDGTMSLSNL